VEEGAERKGKANSCLQQFHFLEILCPTVTATTALTLSLSLVLSQSF